MSNYNVNEFIADDIIIDGDDLVVDGVAMPIKQKLVFSQMSYKRDISKLTNSAFSMYPIAGVGNSTTITIYSMLYHKLPDGSYGERVKGGVIPEYETSLRADFTTWVDNATGEILGLVGEELDPENTQAPLYDDQGTLVQPAGKFYGKSMIKEGQFYDRIAQLSPQVICDLIRASMQLNKHRCQPKARF